MKSSIFWDTTACSPLKVNLRFGGTCRLHLHGWRIRHAINWYEVDASCFSATSTDFQQPTRRYTVLINSKVLKTRRSVCCRKSGKRFCLFIMTNEMLTACLCNAYTRQYIMSEFWVLYLNNWKDLLTRIRHTTCHFNPYLLKIVCDINKFSTWYLRLNVIIDTWSVLGSPKPIKRYDIDIKMSEIHTEFHKD
jgi:hypothetical protein